MGTQGILLIMETQGNTGMKIVSYEKISPFSIGGGGYGNTYRFRCTYDNDVDTISTCERDVASSFKYAGLPVPVELAGPYDCYGHRI